jgi:molybdate transport system substrate-binding protein
MRRAAAALALAALVLGLTACGDDEAGAGNGGERLDVAAAASLTQAVKQYAAEFGEAEGIRVAPRFAGSDELAAQIRQGVRTDVYLAADDKLPAQLAGEGELEESTLFASNRLVVIVPAGGQVTDLKGLEGDGIRLALGDPAVPIGRYAREAIEDLPGLDAQRVLANVRTEEPDVKGVVGKVSQGAVDAGIVYRTDARAAGDDLETIEIPQAAQPGIRYAGGVVSGSENAALAARFLDGLLDGAGRAALDEAGFEPPSAR